jgi:hypothetical protein
VWKLCVFLPFDVTTRVVHFGTRKLVVLSMQGKYTTLRPTATNICWKFDVEGQFSVSRN